MGGYQIEHSVRLKCSVNLSERDLTQFNAVVPV